MSFLHCLISRATWFLDNFSRTSDFLESHGRVVSVLKDEMWDNNPSNKHVMMYLEPVETPFTTCLKILGQVGTLGSRTDATITFSPAIRRSIPLGLASIKDTNTTTRNLQIKLVSRKITTSVGRLDIKAIKECPRIIMIDDLPEQPSSCPWLHQM